MLIVDDELSVRDSLDKWFKEEGYEVGTAENASEALLRLAERVIERTQSQSKIVFAPLPENDPTRRRPDISKAATTLNWRPRVGLREGIDRIIPYFQSQIAVTDTTPLHAGHSLAG